MKITKMQNVEEYIEVELDNGAIFKIDTINDNMIRISPQNWSSDLIKVEDTTYSVIITANRG